jgi:thiol-disulfide isomerase/thioredoxin
LFAAILAWVVAISWIGGRPLVAQKLEILRNRPMAPSLDVGTQWVNAAGPIRVEDLRGKFVMLDFWTYCCSNCMHVLPTLKKLEHAHPNNLVVIGVHSGKFAAEWDVENIRQAVRRYEIEHPVVNDPRHQIWKRYNVDVWPTLYVIDPQGKLVARHTGEFQFEVLDRFLKNQLPAYRRRGLLDESPLRFDLERDRAETTPLEFPGKVLADETSGRLFIADSNHNRIVIAKLDGTLLDTIGTGAIGRQDGGYDEATFDHPQGLALAGESLFVADTENHLIRKIELGEKQVATVAGTGRQADSRVTSGGRALNSPWDVCVVGNNVYIAMAGNHQIWKMGLAARGAKLWAGNGTEDIVDGLLRPRGGQRVSSFAQPSGLTSDGRWLYVADCEGSSIRAVPLSGQSGVRTVLGTAGLPNQRLFTFGDRDGPTRRALLQHPLGVVHVDGRLYIADTYNSKVKELHLSSQTIRTIAAGFDEPAGISYAAGRLYVADTNNHAIRLIDLQRDYAVSTLEITGLKPAAPPKKTQRFSIPGAKKLTFATAKVKPDDNELKVLLDLQLPPEMKINKSAPMSFYLQATEGHFFEPKAVEKKTTVGDPDSQVEIALPLNMTVGKTKIKLSLTYYYCREGSEGLCRVGGVSWLGDIELAADSELTQLELTHTIQ